MVGFGLGGAPEFLSPILQIVDCQRVEIDSIGSEHLVLLMHESRDRGQRGKIPVVIDMQLVIPRRIVLSSHGRNRKTWNRRVQCPRRYAGEWMVFRRYAISPGMVVVDF